VGLTRSIGSTRDAKMEEMLTTAKPPVILDHGHAVPRGVRAPRWLRRLLRARWLVWSVRVVAVVGCGGGGRFDDPIAASRFPNFLGLDMAN